LEQIRYAAKQTGVLVEETVRLKEPGLRLKGQIDFAYATTGRATIVDWKIGDSSGSEDNLQLLSYALAAMQKFNGAPDQIDLYVVYLGDGTIQHHLVNECEVNRAKGRIRQDTQRMLTMDWYGREALAEVFTPCAQKRICELCPYSSVCPGSSNL
jgi:RecB family exonuclease